jgi:hypothetical protein
MSVDVGTKLGRYEIRSKIGEGGNGPLTLHTRHQKDDDLLLSTFVHEQIHAPI